MTHHNEYLNTVARVEPEITPIDPGGGWASIAISLKRIADTLDLLAKAELEKTNTPRRNP